MKTLLKRLRAWPPMNAPLTFGARAIARLLRWQPDVLPRHLHRVGLTTCKLPDGSTLKLWSRGDDWISNRVFWYGWTGYEAETTPLLYALAKRSPATLDVGAYIGFYTAIAAISNRSGIVHAFEPMPAVFRRLQRNVALNRLGNVVVRQAAVGESSGSADFYFSSEVDLPTSSSLSASFMAGTPKLTKQVVEVISLDDYVIERGIERVGLLKIDTESTEPAVLKGARRILERDRPDIICEVLHHRATAAALEEILKPFGYQFYLLEPSGPSRRTRIETHAEYLNYLFTTMTEGEVAALQGS